MSCNRLKLLSIYVLIALIAFSCVQADNGFKPNKVRSRGGLLVKNGKQTSCEIALIDGGSGFVAATCVTNSNGEVDTSSQFKIYTDSANKARPANAAIISSAISVHPDFDMSTFANNIAIVQFALTPAKKWNIPIAINRDEWESTIFVRRHINNIENQNWAAPITATDALTDPECASYSGLFAANKIDFKCGFVSAPPMVGSKCNVPYGTVYGVVSGSASLAGLYSHSVIDGDDMCTSSKTNHYYTLFLNYIAFAQSVLGRDATTFTNTAFTLNSNASYKMEVISSESLENTHVVAGNAFEQTDNNSWITASKSEQPDQLSSAENSASDISQNSNSSSVTSAADATNIGSVNADAHTSTFEDDLFSNDIAQGARDGISTGQIVAIAVCLTIFCIFALLGAYFGWKWYRRRQTTQWSTEHINQILDSHLTESVSGSTPSAKFELPSYRNHRATMLVAAAPHTF